MQAALAPLVAALLFQPRASARLVAGVVYLVAAVSDLIDGEIARRRGEITNFGKLVDPIADKLLLTVGFVILTIPQGQEVTIPLWLAILALFRDFLIVGMPFLIVYLLSQNGFVTAGKAAARIAAENGLEDPARLAAGSTLLLRFDADTWAEARRRAAALEPYNRGVEAAAERPQVAMPEAPQAAAPVVSRKRKRKEGC